MRHTHSCSHPFGRRCALLTPASAKILYKIRGALGKIFRPSWLGPLNLEEFDLGTKKHLTLEGKVARVLTTTIDGELIAEAEAVADAGINLRTLRL